MDLNYEQQVSVQECSGEGGSTATATCLLSVYKGRATKLQLIIHINELGDPSERRVPCLLLQFSLLSRQWFKNQLCSSASEEHQQSAVGIKLPW